MQRLSRWLVVLASAALAACNTMAPIQEVAEVSVATQASKPLTSDQVRAAIVRAGAGLGWIMKDAGPGRLQGTLILRTHSAEVTIPYSAAGYSIKHKASTNLQESGGMIHRNYNGWITNLNRSINAQLAAS